jgi:hypothetical protein
MTKAQAEEQSWIKEELLGSYFGDERLDERLLKLAGELSEHPSYPINQASSDWAATKAAYRFFENPRVTPDKILEQHYANTSARILAEEKVIVVQDTSELDFCRHRATRGLGSIGPKKEDGYEPQGLLFHTTMAFTDKGLPLGLMDHHIWARPEGRKNRKALGSYAHHSLPIEKKESFKWIRGLRATSERTKLPVIMVADREADIFELFDEGLAEGIDLVIRLHHDRMLLDEAWGYLKVSERLAMEKKKAGILLEVPGSGKRKPRIAQLEMRYAPVTVSANGRGISSQSNKDREYDLGLYVVELWEKHPPKGEKPLYWILLTTLPVRTNEEALEVMRYYRMRWSIELYFKCLKTGCNVEDCRLGAADKIINYVSLLSIIAWRILWMTRINRTDPEASCELVFTLHEWQTLWIGKNKRLIKEGKLEPIPPEKPPTVHEAMRWLAMRGGFLGRKGDGEPGLIAIWRGWLTLFPAVEMYEALLPSLKRKTHIRRCG